MGSNISRLEDGTSPATSSNALRPSSPASSSTSRSMFSSNASRSSSPASSLQNNTTTGAVVKESMFTVTAASPSVRPYRGLPREVRDQIWRFVACPPSGIHIYTHKFSPYVSSTRSRERLSFNVMRVSKQTHQELLEILYGENVITLNLTFVVAYNWLKRLQLLRERHVLIKGIALGHEVMHDFAIGTMERDSISDLIAYDLALNTIAIHFTVHSIRDGLRRRGWDLSNSFVERLVVGSAIQEIRLVLPDTLDRRFATNPEDLLPMEVLRDAYDDGWTSKKREAQIRNAFQNGYRPEFASQEDLETYIKSQRRVHDFAVSYGKLRTGEDGTVVVLRKKNGQNEKQTEHRIQWANC